MSGIHFRTRKIACAQDMSDASSAGIWVDMPISLVEMPAPFEFAHAMMSEICSPAEIFSPSADCPRIIRDILCGDIVWASSSRACQSCV